MSSPRDNEIPPLSAPCGRPGLADRVQAAGPTATQGNGTQRTGDLALLNMAYLLEVRATASAGKRLDRTLHIAARTGS